MKYPFNARFGGQKAIFSEEKKELTSSLVEKEELEEETVELEKEGVEPKDESDEQPSS